MLVWKFYIWCLAQDILFSYILLGIVYGETGHSNLKIVQIRFLRPQTKAGLQLQRLVSPPQMFFCCCKFRPLLKTPLLTSIFSTYILSMKEETNCNTLLLMTSYLQSLAFYQIFGHSVFAISGRVASARKQRQGSMLLPGEIYFYHINYLINMAVSLPK